MDGYDPQRADARTLVTLLHLRDIAATVGHPFSITSEMADVRNRSLAEVTRADDFIVSDRLISLLLTQVAENKQLNAGLRRPVRCRGHRDLPRPAPTTSDRARPSTYATVRRGRAPVRGGGDRLPHPAEWNDATRSYGVHVNPRKTPASRWRRATRSSCWRPDDGAAGHSRALDERRGSPHPDLAAPRTLRGLDRARREQPRRSRCCCCTADPARPTSTSRRSTSYLPAAGVEYYYYDQLGSGFSDQPGRPVAVGARPVRRRGRTGPPRARARSPTTSSSTASRGAGILAHRVRAAPPAAPAAGW